MIYESTWDNLRWDAKGKQITHISHHDCSRQSRYEGTPCLPKEWSLWTPRAKCRRKTTHNWFKSHNFKHQTIQHSATCSRPHNCWNVLRRRSLLEVKLDLCLVVSLDKLDMGLTCSTYRGLGRAVSEVWGGLMALLIFQWFQHVPTCHWSRKPSATICKVCKTLQRLAIRTSEHRTYLSFGTPKSYWLRHEILQLQQSNFA